MYQLPKELFEGTKHLNKDPVEEHVLLFGETNTPATVERSQNSIVSARVHLLNWLADVINNHKVLLTGKFHINSGFYVYSLPVQPSTMPCL